MQKRKEKYEQPALVNTINDSSSANLERIEFLQEQLQSWRELTLELEKDLQETKSELMHTNKELGQALLSGIAFDEVKILAHKILQSGKSTSESLAELLTAIYNQPVNLE